MITTYITLIFLLPLSCFYAPTTGLSSRASDTTPDPKWKFQKVLHSTPNQARLQNSCKYRVYVRHAANGKESELQQLSAGGSLNFDANKICGGTCGVSIKVTKSPANQGDFGRPLQFEYTVGPDGMAWYDTSLIDCIKELGGQDASACPGWEAGLIATAGEGSGTPCRRLECEAKSYCPDSAYFDELDKIPNAKHPVGRCDAKLGVAFEICAGL